jgi:hypothetical protein
VAQLIQWLGYGLDGWGSIRGQTGSWAHSASYLTDARVVSWGVKRLGREVGRLPPFTVRFKNAWSLYLHSPIRHGVVLS